MEPVERVLFDAKISKAQIDDIVLVGGSTRIPKIQELLQEYFNGKVQTLFSSQNKTKQKQIRLFHTQSLKHNSQFTSYTHSINKQFASHNQQKQNSQLAKNQSLSHTNKQ